MTDTIMDQAFIMLAVPVIATSWRVALWAVVVALRKVGVCNV